MARFDQHRRDRIPTPPAHDGDPVKPGAPRYVYVIDDDESVADALTRMLSTYGIEAQAFGSVEDFQSARARLPAGCVVADVRMPGMNGLELQRALAEDPSAPPVILITGHGDIPMAVEAMKAGAIDFLEKPIDDVALVAAIERGFAGIRRQEEALLASIRLKARFERLTSRETQVMDLVVSGYSNVAIAAKLGLSARTVEHYRAQVMLKTEAPNLATLVQWRSRLRNGIDA
ncbi:MAG: response regulator [Alphaproteobacteria bacterium]|nr:response regulator [Alphaproteobacteria bacterium]